MAGASPSGLPLLRTIINLAAVPIAVLATLLPDATLAQTSSTESALDPAAETIAAPDNARPATPLSKADKQDPTNGDQQPPADTFTPPDTASPPAGRQTPSDDISPRQPGATPEPRVLVSEVVIEGLKQHPEQERLELAAYDAITVSPGTEVNRSELKDDLAAVYATGWFSDVKIQPIDTPLGVRLAVIVVPNPVLKRIKLDPADAELPQQVVKDTFAADLGRTLNLNDLKIRMQTLQSWYASQGYSLARVSGPQRVSPDGEVELQIRQGIVDGVKIQFVNKDGSTSNGNNEPIKGKTKPWVISREISLKPGQLFNRRDLEEDLKRLYGTGLFSDIKVTLQPVPATPGRVTILLGIVEQSTGSLSGALGYSQNRGIFGQIQLQDTNLLGRAWDLATSFTLAQYGVMTDISFTDPWIKGDPYRTAMRIKAFISRNVPQIFQSENNGNILTASDFYEAPATNIAYNINRDNNPLDESFKSVSKARSASQAVGEDLSWFDYDGDSVVIQRLGGNIQFVRPLNGRDPYKRAPWSVIVGVNAQQVTPMNFAGETSVFGVSRNDFNKSRGEVPRDSVVCIAYNCANHNQLLGIRLAATMNTLDDPRNPTNGNFISLGTEQFVSIGEDSPTFNRIRGSFTHYIPVRWFKFHKGCRPKPGEVEDCKQALAFQFTAGTNVGDLPPYEAFCLGGGNSVRGYYDCDMGVGRSFGEATIEYRFPLIGIFSGELFVDGGTTFSSQENVPGKPGQLLDKPGSGFSVGTGVIVTTPVGPLRLEVASQDFSGKFRFNLGVGWKF